MNKLLLLVFVSFFVLENVRAAGSDIKSGIWRSVTNDIYVVIDGAGIDYFETTRGSEDVGSQPTCLKMRNRDLDGALEFSVPDSVNDFTLENENKISYDSPGNLYPAYLHRVIELPDSCADAVVLRTEYQHDPGLDFDLFWNQLNENYAFFAYRGITQQNWNQIYRQYYPQALETQNGKSMFALLSEIVSDNFGDRAIDGEKIKADEHIQLSAEMENWSFEIESFDDYRRGKAVLANPLDSYLKDRFDHSAFEPLVNKGAIWGIVSFFAKLKNDNVGYLLLNSMVDFNPDESLSAAGHLRYIRLLHSHCDLTS